MKLPQIINKSELARQMGIKPQNLNNKLTKTQRQAFTQDDKNKAIHALEMAISQLKQYDNNTTTI